MKISAAAWTLLLTVLTTSLVVLPLVLPPLPPPPLVLLFIPVGIMAALVFLALCPAGSAGELATAAAFAAL